MDYEYECELFAEALELLERTGGSHFLEQLFVEQIVLRQELIESEEATFH